MAYGRVRCRGGGVASRISGMDTATALEMARNVTAHGLPGLCEAEDVLRAAGHETEAAIIEEYLIDQSDDAWAACGIEPR